MLLLLVASSTLHRSVDSNGNSAASCDVAVIGAGPGGVYAAWRLLKADPSTSVCIFEATERAGGRIYSARGLGPKGDLTAELGAYRFVRNWTKAYGHLYMWTPLTAALVETALQLPIAQYEPGDPTSFMYKIVDAAGHNAGYDTFVTKMLGEATAAGARVEYKRQLVSISGTAAAPVLHFAAGDDVKPGRVLLNLPQLPLLRLLSASPALTRGRPFPPALMAPSPTEGAKLYVRRAPQRPPYFACPGVPRARCPS